MLRRRPNFRAPKKFYTINDRIQAASLRVLDDEGKQVGVMTGQEAQAKARGLEVDLVLIAPNAVPPVAKIIDFKKFLYQEGKKEKEARKGSKRSTSKEMKLSLFMAEGDRTRLLERGRHFLDSGSQLRLSLGMRGRELGKREMAFEKIRAFIAELGEVNIAKEPRMEGRVIRAVVSKRK